VIDSVGSGMTQNNGEETMLSSFISCQSNWRAKMKSSAKKYGFYLLTLVFFVLTAISMVLLGMRSASRHDRIFQLVSNMKNHFISAAKPKIDQIAKKRSVPIALRSDPVMSDISGKHELPKPAVTSKTVVAFAFGQSNAANSSSVRNLILDDRVLNYWDGKFYMTSDPLLGSTGGGGSVWTLVAYKLMQMGIAEKVILISSAVGGTSVVDWTSGGELYQTMVKRLDEAVKEGLSVNYFLWHQGETDHPYAGGVGLVEYEEGMKQIISLTKKYFPTSKFFVSIATRCGDLGPSKELQNTQRNLSKLKGVFLGPNTDDIGNDGRYDRCHLSGSGIDTHSDRWVNALIHPQHAD
jgi:hypothetical protein